MEKVMDIMTSKWTILGLQLLASLLFAFVSVRLDAIPMSYLIYGAIAMGCLLLLYYYIFYTGEKKIEFGDKSKRVIGVKVVSLLTSIALLIGTFMIARGDLFINNITGAKEQKYVINIRVLNESKITKLEDIKGLKLGVNYHTDSSNLVNALADVDEKIGEDTYEIVEYDDFLTLSDGLYDKEIDAMICGNEYLGIMAQNHSIINDETRVIYSFEVGRKVEVTTNPTNVTENAFILYLTGIDVEGDVETVSRSDVNLVAVVHPKTRQVLMISLPRDTEIKLAFNGATDKLTHTGIYGTSETINSIELLFDIDINYFGRTNFSGLEQIVDALGGVTIDSPYPTFVTRQGNITVEPGIHHFDGYEALCFVRERKSLPNGDFDRGQNQQRLLRAMLEKVISPKIITNFDGILSAIEDCFETDMTEAEMKSLINMQLNDMSSWEVFNVQLTGYSYKSTQLYSLWGTPNYVMTPDQTSLEEIKALIHKVQNGELLTSEDVEGLSGPQVEQ